MGTTEVKWPTLSVTEAPEKFKNWKELRNVWTAQHKWLYSVGFNATYSSIL